MDRWTEGWRRWDQEGDRKGYFKQSPAPFSLASRGKRGMTDHQGCSGAQLAHSSSGVSDKHADSQHGWYLVSQGGATHTLVSPQQA